MNCGSHRVLVTILLCVYDLSTQTCVEMVIQFGDDTTLVFQADSTNDLEMKFFVDCNIKSRYIGENNLSVNFVTTILMYFRLKKCK